MVLGFADVESGGEVTPSGWSKAKENAGPVQMTKPRVYSFTRVAYFMRAATTRSESALNSAGVMPSPSNSSL